MQASALVLNLCINRIAVLRRNAIAGLKTVANCFANTIQNLSNIKFLIIALTMLSAPMQASSQTTSAEDEDWWFDVEVIAFKRNTSNTTLEEDFSYTELEMSLDSVSDLISLPLYRQANPLIDLQQMLYECSANHSIFQSNLAPLAIPNIDFELAKSSEDAFIDPGVERFKARSPMLDTEARFSILFAPQNCSETKIEIARSLLTINTSNETPTYLQQPVLDVTQNAHLLADQQLTLIDYAKRLFAQRDISALSHIAWRQPVVFGEENAKFYRLFSGNKLTLPTEAPPSYEVLKQKYDPELNNIIEQDSETFFAELKQQLEEAKPVNWKDRDNVQANNSDISNSLDDVWELDGKVKVYLNYINRVPYLHIDSEFEFHELQLNSFGEAEIEQYPFKQRRRVISKQIHYFDHPKIGIIIRLERYEKPKEVDNEDIY